MDRSVLIFHKKLCLMGRCSINDWSGLGPYHSVYHCNLDPCSSWLIKTFQELACVEFQVVLNASLWQWLVWPALRKVVYPLLRRPSLDSMVLNNFCSVFNFPFLGKIVEMMIRFPLQSALGEKDYVDPFSQDSGQL